MMSRQVKKQGYEKNRKSFGNRSAFLPIPIRKHSCQRCGEQEGASAKNIEAQEDEIQVRRAIHCTPLQKSGEHEKKGTQIQMLAVSFQFSIIGKKNGKEKTESQEGRENLVFKYGPSDRVTQLVCGLAST